MAAHSQVREIRANCRIRRSKTEWAYFLPSSRTYDTSWVICGAVSLFS